MQEEWRDVKGYEGIYQVSNTGKIRSLDRICRNGIKKNGECSYSVVKGRELSLTPSKDGYIEKILCKDGKGKTYKLHRLIALAFIPNPENKPEVNHIDGDKTNNDVRNLEWVTCSENLQHAYDTGLREQARQSIGERNKKYKSKMVICNETGEIFVNAHEVQRVIGIRQQNVCNCCNGKVKSAGTFIDPDGNVVKRTWRYLEE